MGWAGRLGISAAILAALAVSACDSSDRPLTYNKGEYAGPADTKLTPQQTEALRERLNNQRGV